MIRHRHPALNQAPKLPSLIPALIGPSPERRVRNRECRGITPTTKITLPPHQAIRWHGVPWERWPLVHNLKICGQHGSRNRPSAPPITRLSHGCFMVQTG